MQVITVCPICGNSSFQKQFNCTDHTVSKEEFDITSCTQCGFFCTNPRPENAHLGKYYLSNNYISHSKKINSITDIIYRLSRVYTLNWKYQLVTEYSKSSSPTLLDYGCGTGDFLLHAKTKGATVQGVEPSDIARKIAEQKLTQNITTDLDQVATTTYNAITLWHVLEHVPDLNEKIHTLKNHLTQNGIMFIAVPNHESPDAKRFGRLWAGYDVPRHLWHFSQKNMHDLLEKHQLKLQAVIPMKLDAYYVSILSNKYQGSTGLAGFAKGLLNGWKSNINARKNNNYSSLIYIASKK